MSDITIDIFSKKSIDKAIKELEKRRESLQIICENLIDELANIGIKTASSCVRESELANAITVKISDFTSTEMGCKAVIIASGKVYTSEKYDPFYTVLAVEFGAGISYNRGNENPNASEFGYGVGTFPGQVHAFEEGWYYFGEDNKWHYTKGIKATMPMYNAQMEILQSMSDIGKKVIGETKLWQVG